jgi:hypothetical protein
MWQLGFYLYLTFICSGSNLFVNLRKTPEREINKTDEEYIESDSTDESKNIEEDEELRFEFQ